MPNAFINPMCVTKATVEHYGDLWAAANTRAMPYLPYKGAPPVVVQAHKAECAYCGRYGAPRSQCDGCGATVHA